MCNVRRVCRKKQYIDVYSFPSLDSVLFFYVQVAMDKPKCKYERRLSKFLINLLWMKYVMCTVVKLIALSLYRKDDDTLISLYSFITVCDKSIL